MWLHFRVVPSRTNNCGPKKRGDSCPGDIGSDGQSRPIPSSVGLGDCRSGPYDWRFRPASSKEVSTNMCPQASRIKRVGHSSAQRCSTSGPLRLGSFALLCAALAFAGPTTACRQPSPASDNPPPTADAVSLEERVRRSFESMLGTPHVPVQIVHLEPVTWPDTCLGTVRPRTTCVRQNTAGYRAQALYNNEQTYELRTDLDLRTLLWIEAERIEGVITSLDSMVIIIQGQGPRFQQPSILPGFVQAGIHPGTQFLTPATELSVGQKVTLGINPRPSSDFPILVWIARSDQ